MEKEKQYTVYHFYYSKDNEYIKSIHSRGTLEEVTGTINRLYSELILEGGESYAIEPKITEYWIGG